jgi:hypothetical protein
MSSLADEIRAELRRLAEDVGRRSLHACDATGVYVEAQPAARRAALLLIRAACEGLLGDPRAVVDRIVAVERPDPPPGPPALASPRAASSNKQHNPTPPDPSLSAAGQVPRRVDPGDNFVEMLLIRGRAAELKRPPTPDELRVTSPLSDAAIDGLSQVTRDDFLLNTWAVVICRYLRASRPGEFSPDPGEYDFPALPDEVRRWLIAQRGAGEFDWQAAASSRVAHSLLPPIGEYTPAERLTHARAQARIWAEAMRAAANLIGDAGEAPDRGKGAQGFVTAEDCSWVRCPSGSTFHFPESMRQVVARLCADQFAGKPSSDGAELLKLTTADSLEKVFKVRVNRKLQTHPAWGTMIVPVDAPGARGQYTLKDPSGPSRPAPRRPQSPRRSSRKSPR